jgi:hypothetical protein
MPELAVVVCQLLRRELNALRAAGRLDARLETLAHPCDPTATERVTLADALVRRGEREPRALVLGGGCMRGVEPPAVDRERLAMLVEPTCFELVAPPALVQHLISSGAHLVTPGWLAQWQVSMKAWALDCATARQLFAESATRLVLLDTGVDPEAPERLRALAEYVALPSEVLPVGLDYLALRLCGPAGASAARAISLPPDRAAKARKLADYGAVLDFTSRIAGTLEESDVFERAAELCGALFAPATIVFVPIVEGEVRPPMALPADATLEPEAREELLAFAERAAVAADGASLLLRIGEREQLGVMRVGPVAFPKYLQDYVSVGALFAEALALGLLHARKHFDLREAQAALRAERDALEARVLDRTAELEHTVEELRQASQAIVTLRGLLPICCGCKKVREGTGYWKAIEEYLTQHSEATFSHGLCPDCLQRLYPEFADDPEATDAAGDPGERGERGDPDASKS